MKYASFQFAVKLFDSWWFYEGDFHSNFCFGLTEVVKSWLLEIDVQKVDKNIKTGYKI